MGTAVALPADELDALVATPRKRGASQANIVERDEVEHTIAERNVLAKIRHPFIVNLKFSFQTADKLYLVLSFVNGGEVRLLVRGARRAAACLTVPASVAHAGRWPERQLFKHLQDVNQFEEDRARFYAAELLLALEHLHTYGIIYRCVPRARR